MRRVPECVAAISAFLALTLPALAAGDCFVIYPNAVPGRGFVFGSDAYVAMTVPKGTVCREPVRAGGGTILSSRITTKSRLGIAAVSSTTNFAYKAPNQPGRDSFVLTLTGQEPGGPVATSNLHFTVTITD
jgi:hypothetical protein